MKDIDIQKFWKEGYLHIKSVFSADEIKSFRERLVKVENRKLNNNENLPELISNDVFSDVMLDDRIVSIYKKILGGQPVYFGDSGYTVRPVKHPVGKYHKDCTDRNDNKGPDWKGEYPIVRFGLYLQDHKNQGGGILIGKNSHKNLYSNRKLEVLKEEIFGWLKGDYRYVPTETGDIVMWTLRTTHAPMGRYLKYFFKKPISNKLQKFIPDFLQTICKEDRYFFYGVYGLDGSHLKRYVNYLKTRKYMVDTWKSINVSNDSLEKMRQKGIKYLDMKEEILRDISQGKSNPKSGWNPFPY